MQYVHRANSAAQQITELTRCKMQKNNNNGFIADNHIFKNRFVYYFYDIVFAYYDMSFG